jgi:hypothetical protein
MPVLTPTGLVFSIGDLVPEVIKKVENRTNETDRAAAWLRDAILEITSNADYRDEFDQLETWGLPFVLTSGIQEYPEGPLLPPVTSNLGNMDFLIWLDPVTNKIRKRLDYMSVLESDRFQPLNSLPTQWYRFNSNIGFNPVPDQGYQVQSRFVKQHPINDNVLTDTQLLIPREWNHLFVLAAAELGFIELGEYDKATSIHTLLYGDPNQPDKEPGMFKKAKRRHERERWRMTAALRPVYKPSSWGK